ncbi:hypothetical protein V6N12_058524 [Hibiscus sabdariffa]|uniref:Uncharacterized protein n=1 Tax=Hibiscus sabdariffa TaxID=183260 RepID=A0ABR2EU96_9ROSI
MGSLPSTSTFPSGWRLQWRSPTPAGATIGTSRTMVSSSGDILLPWPHDFSPNLGRLWSLRSEPGSRKRWREKRGGQEFLDGGLNASEWPL